MGKMLEMGSEGGPVPTQEVHPGPKPVQGADSGPTGQASGSLSALFLYHREAMRELIPLSSKASLAALKGLGKPDCPGSQEKR